MSFLLKYTPELSQESLESIYKVCKLFTDKNGRLNCENLIFALKELKFDEQEPVIFDIIDEICSDNKNGITEDEFINKINESLQDRSSQKSTERTYELFVEDPKANLTAQGLEKVARNVGDDAPVEEIKKIFNFASSNGNDIPYEEFHSIMIKSLGNENENEN